MLNRLADKWRLMHCYKSDKIMAKICNQTFVKDTHRDKKYIGTMKCISCGEESNISLKFPCKITDFNKEIQAFQKLHQEKGCNKKQLKAPEWACESFEVGIAAG